MIGTKSLAKSFGARTLFEDVTLQLNANNLLNSVTWSAIDTNPLSRTYGNVISVRPMRTLTFTMRFRF